MEKKINWGFVSCCLAGVFFTAVIIFGGDKKPAAEKPPAAKDKAMTPSAPTPKMKDAPDASLMGLWNFDDKAAFLSDGLGRTAPKMALAATKSGVAWKGGDAKYGAGAVCVNGGRLRLAPLPPFMSGTLRQAFSVLFWFRSSKKSLTSDAGKNNAPNLGRRLFYFGEAVRDPSGKNSLSLFYNVMTDLLAEADGKKFRDPYGVLDMGPDFALSDWVHVGVVVMPIAPARRKGNANATLKLYVNGVLKRAKDIAFDAGPDPVLYLGSGWGTRCLMDVADTQFDQLMIFNRALTQAQVTYYASRENPLE